MVIIYIYIYIITLKGRKKKERGRNYVTRQNKNKLAPAECTDKSKHAYALINYMSNRTTDPEQGFCDRRVFFYKCQQTSFTFKQHDKTYTCTH